ncbi:MAG: hypothetical protein J7M19_00790 [Planctomycetes bacterium]|nr:hypothetical protein [Planctomycetota bacterium]
MKEMKILVVVALLLAFAGISHALADEAGVLAKIDEATKAAKADAAKEALDAAGDLVVKDMADGDDYCKAMGRAVKGRVSALKTLYVGDKKPKGTVIEVIKMRVTDLYGAIIPVAQGKNKDAAAYIKAKAAGAPEEAKGRLEAAAAAIAKGENAAQQLKVGIAVSMIGKTQALIGSKDYKAAAFWANEASRYIKADAATLTGERAMQVSEVGGIARTLSEDLAKSIPTEPEDIVELMDNIQEIFLAEK